MASRVYQMVISTNVAGQFCQSIFHWKFEDSGYTSTFAAAQALNERFIATKAGSLKNCCPTATSFLSFKSRLVQASGGFEHIAPIAAGETGNRPGDVSVSGLSAVVVFYPSTNSPIRGRWFIPGLSDTDVEGGILTEDYKSDLATSLNTVFDPMTLVGGGAPEATFCLYNRVAKLPYTGDISWLLSDKVGTQRRRQRPY